MPGLPSWQTLLEHAQTILATASSATGAPIEWSLGGGTVLMLHYEHRTSRDIDIFIKDPQALTALSPRLNECAASLASDYVESSSFVKITRSEGEIDFIVAPDLTDQPHTMLNVAGSEVRTDAPVEIVIKKAFYRAAELRIRDVFDLAVVIDRERKGMERNARILAGKTPLLLKRVRRVASDFSRRARNELMLLPAGEAYTDRAVPLVIDFLERR